MHWLDYLQWPAMLVTVVAAWLVASAHRRRRKVGFWVFLASNLLWIAWGLYAQAYALILLQVCLAAMNLRGTHRNEAPQERWAIISASTWRRARPWAASPALPSSASPTCR